MSFKDKLKNINIDEKGVVHDLISIKDSLLNSELLREKKKKENYGIIITIIAHFFLAVNQLQLKTFAKWFKNEYTQNNLLVYRSLATCAISYYLIKRKNETIPSLLKINSKFWFFCRECGAYIILFFYLEMTTYFRVSTCQCIYGCHPIIVLLLSIIIINENFYWRYVVGMILSFIGSIFILLNEVQPEQRKQNDNKSVFIGIIFSFGYLTTLCVSKFAQKMLCKDHMTPEVQTFYLGFFTALQAFIFLLFDFKLGLNLIYILYCFSNGLIFCIVNMLCTEAMGNLAISKYLPLTYFATVFIFILGWIVLGERVYFTDIVGSLLIVGFQIYNAWFPVIKINKDKNKDNK